MRVYDWAWLFDPPRSGSRFGNGILNGTGARSGSFIFELWPAGPGPGPVVGPGLASGAGAGAGMGPGPGLDQGKLHYSKNICLIWPDSYKLFKIV